MLLNQQPTSVFRKYSLPLLLGLIVFAHIPFFYGFPLPYGWWQTYAYLSNLGLDLYQDQQLTFTPLYIWFYKVLPEIFIQYQWSITLGIFRTLLLFLIIYFYLKKKSTMSASITGVVVIYVVCRQGIYLPDDYHTFVSTIVVMALICAKIWIDARSAKSLLALAILSSLCYMTKQNIGLMLIFGSLGLVAFESIRTKKVVHLFIFIVELVSVLFFISAVLNVNINLHLLLTLQNDAKGGLGALLARPFENNLVLYIFQAATVILVAQLVVYYWPTIRGDSGVQKILLLRERQAWQSFVHIFQVLVCTFLLYKLASDSNFLIKVVILYTCFNLIYGKKNRALSFLYAALLLANTLTAGLASDDLVFIAIPVILEISRIIERVLVGVEPVLKNAAQIFCLSFCTFLLLGLTAKKIADPWRWYGMESSNVGASIRTFNNGSPVGTLRVDEATFNILNGVQSVIERHSEGQDDVLFFPSIPYFYVLFGKVPPYGVPVYWFDTTRNSVVDNLKSSLDRSPPKIIVELVPPRHAFLGHAVMKNMIETPQEKLSNILNERVRDGTYAVVFQSIALNTSTKAKTRDSKIVVDFAEDKQSDRVESWASEDEKQLKFSELERMLNTGEMLPSRSLDLPTLRILLRK